MRFKKVYVEITNSCNLNCSFCNNNKRDKKFMLIDSFAINENLTFRENSRLKCFMTNLRNGIDDYLLIKPTTFMNLSGEAVRAVIDYYKIAIEDVLIVYDDLSLELGKVRFRPNGSDGGHNGIKSIIQHLGTKEIARLLHKSESAVRVALSRARVKLKIQAQATAEISEICIKLQKQVKERSMRLKMYK